MNMQQRCKNICFLKNILQLCCVLKNQGKYKMASFKRLAATAITLLMLVLGPLQWRHHHPEDHHGHQSVVHQQGHHCNLCDFLHHPSPGLLNDGFSFDLARPAIVTDGICTIISSYHSHITEADASRGPPARA